MPQRKLKGGNQLPKLEKLNSVLPPPPPKSPRLQRVNSKDIKYQTPKPSMASQQRNSQSQSGNNAKVSNPYDFPPLPGMRPTNVVNPANVNVTAQSNVYLPFYDKARGTLYMYPESAYPKPNSNIAITNFSGNGIRDYYVVTFKPVGSEGVAGTLDKITRISKSSTNSISTPQMHDVDLSNVSIHPTATNAAISAIQNMIVKPDGKLRFIINTNAYNSVVASVIYNKIQETVKNDDKIPTYILSSDNTNDVYEVSYSNADDRNFSIYTRPKTGWFNFGKTKVPPQKVDKASIRGPTPTLDDFQENRVKSLMKSENGILQFDILPAPADGGKKKQSRKNGLEARTVAELKERCAKRGIKVRAGMKKADLVAALRRR